jgi:neutral ceramidase
VKVRLQAIRIGSLGIVSSPCETFTETGLAVKKDSPLSRTFTIELANGYNGYLPPPEQHRLGGYETWRARSSYLAADAEPKVRESMLKLLRAVAE